MNNMFATTHQGIEVVWFLLGGGAVALVWFIAFLCNLKVEPKHEEWKDGYFYSTRKAHRICGKVSERITGDGQWISSIVSLWRGYQTYERYNYNGSKPIKGTEYRFFTLSIDELRAAKITPTTQKEAIAFITENVKEEEEVKALIKDWFGDNK